MALSVLFKESEAFPPRMKIRGVVIDVARRNATIPRKGTIPMFFGSLYVSANPN